MKIYLIRHSESIDDIENCYGGIADFDLTEEGKNKVKEKREEIASYGIERIYTSPYKRAYQTAQILNEIIQVEMKVMDDIRELNSHGVRSGVNKELANNIFQHILKSKEYQETGYYLGRTFLGGEDIGKFDERVRKAMNCIVKDSEGLNTIAVVTHGNVHKSIFKNVLNVNKKIDKIDDVAITTINYNDSKFEILETKGIKFGENKK